MTPPLNFTTLEAEADAYRRVRRAMDGPAGSSADEAFHQIVLVFDNATKTIVTGSQGYRIAVHLMLLYNAGDQVDLDLLNGAEPLGISFPAAPQAMGIFLPWSDHPYFLLSPGAALNLQLSNPTTVNSRVTGFLKYRMRDAIGG